MIVEINSYHLKVALMHYYRYKRQFVCCDEVTSFGSEIADILVDTGKYFIEVEIKTSKSDLIAEKKKAKHKKNESGRTSLEWAKCCNYFYLCVPSEIADYAENWIKEVNPKYGLILFNSNHFNKIEELKSNHIFDKYVTTVKRGKKLHDNYSKRLKENMSRRMSSALTLAYTRDLLRIMGYNNRS